MVIRVSGAYALDNLSRRVDTLRGSAFCGDVADNLARKAADHGNALYSIADYAGTLGLTSVDVEESRLGDNARDVVVSGETAAFIEYGTGVMHREGDYGDWSALYPNGVLHHGDYGLGLGKHTSWVYKGDPGTKGHSIGKGNVRTSGNEPAEVVPAMADMMVREAPNSVREVLEI